MYIAVYTPEQIIIFVHYTQKWYVAYVVTLMFRGLYREDGQSYKKG
jgi:hypothetical protein